MSVSNKKAMAIDGIGDQINQADFVALAEMLKRSAGIVLGSNKRELVVGRLNRRLRALGLRSFADYIALLQGPDGKAEREEMVNALTTNLTSFFRETHHFRYLADHVLPKLLAEREDKRLRIWSAACSSGEEPYSIAMVLNRALANKPDWDARILATDIDTNMVAVGERGGYDPERVATIPAEFVRQLMRQPDGSVSMPDVLKQRIAFRALNLLGTWPMRGKFDIVFCRNVVIYFDKDTQRILFDRIADIMSPNGWLFIGHSETLFRVSERFESLGRTIYQRLP